MVNVKKANKGYFEKEVYFLHQYIPKKRWSDFSGDKRVETSKKILDYKDNDEEAIEYFTEQLMEAIAYLSNNVMGSEVEKLALVPVPPSDKDKNKSTPMRESIFRIKEWYEKGITKSKYGCSKKIYNYSNMIYRYKTVNSSHNSKPEDRPSYLDHKHSIGCRYNNLSKHYATFILIDDITTRGTIMDACEGILLEHGAVKRYIYRLAIGETIR